MKLCLDCRRVWPAEALICGSCRRSFGGRLCPGRHLSPSRAACCTTCGSRKLLQPARFLNLGLPTRLCAWAIGLLLLKLAIANLGTLIHLAACFAFQLGSWLVGAPLVHLVCLLLPYVVVTLIFWVGFRTILGAKSLPVQMMERAFLYTLRNSPKVLAWWARTAVKAISRRSTPSNQSGKGRST
jgi:hypothetical protein